MPSLKFLHETNSAAFGVMNEMHDTAGSYLKKALILYNDFDELLAGASVRLSPDDLKKFENARKLIDKGIDLLIDLNNNLDENNSSGKS